MTATGSWSISWQVFSGAALDEPYVPFLAAFGAACHDAMVARWSANPLGMLWPEMDAAFVGNGGGSPPARPLEALPQGRCRMIWHRMTRRETERVLRRIPPLDWQRFAPLFRPEWEHPAELDLTPIQRDRRPRRLRSRGYPDPLHHQDTPPFTSSPSATFRPSPTSGPHLLKTAGAPARGLQDGLRKGGP